MSESENNDESAKLAFELYQHLGQSMVSFFTKKRAEHLVTDGGALDIRAQELITAILSFAATELSSLLVSCRTTDFKRGDVADTITSLMSPFRQLLERDLNELISKSKESDAKH